MLLNKTVTQHQETGKGLSYCDMAKDLTKLKKHEDFLWLQDASSSALQQSLKDLEKAFKGYKLMFRLRRSLIFQWQREIKSTSLSYDTFHPN